MKLPFCALLVGRNVDTTAGDVASAVAVRRADAVDKARGARALRLPMMLNAVRLRHIPTRPVVLAAGLRL